MDSARVNDWLQILGMGGIIASLVFVGLELRQSHQVALNETGFARAESQHGNRSEINQYADIWARGNADEALEEAERIIYTNLIENEYASAFWGWQPRRELGSIAELPVHQFSVFLFLNPGARKTWENQMEVRRTYRNPLFSPDRLADGEAGALSFPQLVYADLKKLGEMFN